MAGKQGNSDGGLGRIKERADKRFEEEGLKDKAEAAKKTAARHPFETAEVVGEATAAPEAAAGDPGFWKRAGELKKSMAEEEKNIKEERESMEDAQGEERNAEQERRMTAGEEAKREFEKRKHLKDMEEQEKKNSDTWSKKAGRGAKKAGAAAGRAMNRDVNVGGAARRAASGMSALAAAPVKVTESAFWFFLVALAVHIVDIFHNFGQGNRGITGLRFGLYVFLMLYAWFALYGGAGAGLKSLEKPLAVSALAFFLPLVVSLLIEIPVSNEMKLTTIIVLMCIPVWPVVVAFGISPQTTFFKWVRIIFVGLWIVLALPTIYSALATDLNLGRSDFEILNAIRYMFSTIKNNLLTIWGGIASIPKLITGGIQTSIQHATGDYYTGMVDENQDKPIGVYLEDVKAANTEFYEDESVVVWGTIKARTLNPDEEIHISTSCYAHQLAEEEKKVKGDADPTGPNDEFEMTVTVMEEKDVSCEFSPSELEDGQWSAYFLSTFNFDTHSYLKSYFMEQGRLRAARRENKDPLITYGITDKSPLSVSTNGPVQVNMEITQALTGLNLDPSEKNELRLGITLRNRWEGSINEINDLIIKVPPSMSISFCDHNIKPESCSGQECEDGKYDTIYRLQARSSEGKKGREGLDEIKTFHSFNCKIKVDNANAALGSSPLTTHYFKASADYVYELKKETPLTIKESTLDEEDEQ